MSSFTADELVAIAHDPRDRIAALIDSNDHSGARALAERLETEYHRQLKRYAHWVTALFGFAVERGRASEPVDATRRYYARFADIEPIERDTPSPAADAVAATETLDAWTAEWRSLIDCYRDWISALLSDIYRRHGADELEIAHRRVGEVTMRNLTANLDAPVRERLESFVWLLQAHFSEVDVEEDDEKFVITQHPCGTCGRQARDGRYGAPLDLALVDEPHAVTWGRGNTTIYRTHIPIWHVAMATEQIGVPWPVNQCPPGADGAPCRILLYKDPRDPAATAEVPRPG